MGGVIIMGLIVLIFLIISIVFLQGKGSFLISGYNTASKEEQEKYDEKKLCKSMGVCTLIVTFLMAILMVLGYFVESGKMQESTLGPIALVFTGLIIVDVAVEIIYSNKKCKKDI